MTSYVLSLATVTREKAVPKCLQPDNYYPKHSLYQEIRPYNCTESFINVKDAAKVPEDSSNTSGKTFYVTTLFSDDSLLALSSALSNVNL